jgi:hypothetical protein
VPCDNRSLPLEVGDGHLTGARYVADLVEHFPRVQPCLGWHARVEAAADEAFLDDRSRQAAGPRAADTAGENLAGRADDDDDDVEIRDDYGLELAACVMTSATTSGWLIMTACEASSSVTCASMRPTMNCCR